MGFAAKSLHSYYTDTVELTSKQLQVPNLLERLRNLRKVTALSPKLAETLKTYTTAQTKEGQATLLNELITQ